MKQIFVIAAIGAMWGLSVSAQEHSPDRIIEAARRAAEDDSKRSPDHVVRNDPRFGLLTPLPETGGIPAIYDRLYSPSPEEMEYRARERQYESQIKEIQRDYFGRKTSEERRRKGIEELHEFTDPAAFLVMIEVLGDEEDDVRLAVLDHFSDQGEYGQAALAHTAIYNDDDAIRNEAVMRIEAPAPQPTLAVLDQALRSSVHKTVNRAGTVAGVANALQSIPLLIFAQAADDPRGEEGDLAWIAIQTQTAYVANVEPVVGDGAGAFAPVAGVLNEGVVLRVMDAVVVTYRTEVHNALVSMTTLDSGQSTAYLGYDMGAWWRWYNTQYLPKKNAEIELARLKSTENDD